MKRSAIVALALLMALAIAAPAYAKRTPTTPIAVGFEAAPRWVHESSDLVTFNLEITNKANSPIDVTITRGTESFDATIPSREAQRWDSLWPMVVDREIDGPDMVETVTVAWDEGSLDADATIATLPTPPCEFTYSGGETTTDPLVGAADLAFDFDCIWAPPKRGTWEVAMTPDATRRVRTSWTVRDHVPGNWCGSAGARWQPGGDPVTGTVYLPGPSGTHGDGVCYDGGIGGAGWFPIGNPGSFYLVANGHVTVTWLGSGQG